MLDHSNSMNAPSPDVRRDSWQVLDDVLTAMLPLIGDALDLGAPVYPLPRVDIETSGCDFPPTILGTPIELMNTTTVLGYVAARAMPSGGTPTFVALQHASEALGTPGPEDAPRFIVLGTDGAPDSNASFTRATCDCPGPINSCVGDDGLWTGCFDRDRVVALIRALAAQRVYTVLIGIQTADTSFDVRTDAILDAMAVAGGRPVARGPHRFYAGTDDTTLAVALTATLGPLAFCRLHAVHLQVDAEQVDLMSSDAVTPLRDRTRVDGWDWLDAMRGELGLFGPACDRAVATRAHEVCEQRLRRGAVDPPRAAARSV